jgi:DNA-binding protein YbaB
LVFFYNTDNNFIHVYFAFQLCNKISVKENDMTPQQIKEVQEKFLLLQSQIQETVVSGEGEIKAVFNGNVQLVELEFLSNKSLEQLKPELIETINRGIKTVSEKIQSIMKTIQQEIQSSGHHAQ